MEMNATDFRNTLHQYIETHGQPQGNIWRPATKAMSGLVEHWIFPDSEGLAVGQVIHGEDNQQRLVYELSQVHGITIATLIRLPNQLRVIT